MKRKNIMRWLYIAALSVLFAGCSANSRENSYTEVAQKEVTASEKEIPSAPSPTPAKVQGFIPPSIATQTVTPSPTENPYIEIETVQTCFDKYVVVTLDGYIEKPVATDIQIRGYSDNWYSLKASSYAMQVTDTVVTVNEEGKTVIIYEVSERIDGTKVITDTSNKKFSNLQAEITKAENYMSWQMDHGGWDKGVENQAKKAWTSGMKKNATSGWFGAKGELIGTIDNEATYTQIRQIAAVYREVPEKKYQESVLRGLDFIFHLQYESGGFAQVYPARGNYSDNVTFNDDAMINVLILLEDVRDGRYPFDSDIVPEEYRVRAAEAIESAIDYILKAQIVQNGKLTAWCAQHDPVTYEPVGARSYEHPSISGFETVGIVKFLMNQEQTPEIAQAIEAAVRWLKDSEVKGIKYIRKDTKGVYFVEDKNSSIWYRFYDIETNEPIFSDRDGIIKHNILEIGEERRHGYTWADDEPKEFLEVYDSIGYFSGRIEALVVEVQSVTEDGKTLEKGTAVAVSGEIQ